MTLPVGYYEQSLPNISGEIFVGVWLPLRAAGEPLGTYKSSILMDKKLKMMLGMSLKDGMPKWIPTCCLPKVNTPIPTANPLLGAATPDMVAEPSSIRGLVVYAHGLSDGPASLAHVCEKLASLGFIVAAPSFSDDDSNGAVPALAAGNQFIGLQQSERIKQMDTTIATLLEQYGRYLPLALIGYSTGTDTILQMAAACPRVYVGGPGWQQSVGTPAAIAAPPGGPSLQLLASPDEMMVRQGFTSDESSAITGFPVPHNRARVTPERIAQAATEGDPHLRVDMEGYSHASFKYPPFAASEDSAWRRAFCGVDIWAVQRMASGNPATSPPSNEVAMLRANASADIIASYLMAAVERDYEEKIDAASA
jgi:dienelactone hydrolase